MEERRDATVNASNAAFESVTVTPQAGGRIVERHFQDGENLKIRRVAVCHRPSSQQSAARETLIKLSAFHSGSS
jgi:multidrug efflux pump subunit AcrA (membrane-fusion protein)